MRLNNRGAASILVILIIVVLATFGGIALTAGWTNKQLSIKAAQSKADYYALDSAAEEIIAETDSLLYQAMNETADHLGSLAITSDASLLEEQETLQTLFASETYNIKSTALMTKKISEAFRRIYYYKCAKSLEAFAAEKGLTLVYSGVFFTPDDFLSPKRQIPENGDLLIEFMVSEGAKPGQKSLDIKVAVNAPIINVKIINEETWRTDFKINIKENAERFEIYSWKLGQNPIEYDEENPKFG